MVLSLILKFVDYLFHLFDVLFSKEPVGREMRQRITDVVLSMWMLLSFPQLDEISQDLAFQLYKGRHVSDLFPREIYMAIVAFSLLTSTLQLTVNFRCMHVFIKP